MGPAKCRCLALLALASACGSPGAKTASPDAATSRPPGPPAADAALDASTVLDFTETFAPGSDTGHWILTTSSMRPRMVNATGGNPGGYLYAEVSTGSPTWYTMSTRYSPGMSDSVKRDSVYVGDFATRAITHITVDLDIQQSSWSIDRTLTIELRTWDPSQGMPALVADCSLPDIANPPSGWNHYDFMIDGASPTVPAGWTLVRGDGSQADPIEWATLMHQIDFVGIGYWKPGYSYPGGNWSLGIDNIHITAQ